MYFSGTDLKTTSTLLKSIKFEKGIQPLSLFSFLSVAVSSSRNWASDRQGKQKVVASIFSRHPAQKKVFIVHSFLFSLFSFGFVIYFSGPSLYGSNTNGYYGWHEDPERDKPKAQAWIYTTEIRTKTSFFIHPVQVHDTVVFEYIFLDEIHYFNIFFI